MEEGLTVPYEKVGRLVHVRWDGPNAGDVVCFMQMVERLHSPWGVIDTLCFTVSRQANACVSLRPGEASGANGEAKQVQATPADFLTKHLPQWAKVKPIGGSDWYVQRFSIYRALELRVPDTPH